MNDKNDAATAAADKAVKDNSEQEDKDIADEDDDEDEDVAEDEADVECKEDPETFQPIECKIKDKKGHLTCVPIKGTKIKGKDGKDHPVKSADDDGMCSTEADKSNDFDAMNDEEDKEIGQNSAEGEAWKDSVYTKDASKSQVIGDAEAAAGHAADAAQAKAVKDNRAKGYTGPSWGHSEELMQTPDTVAATKKQAADAAADAASTASAEEAANAESAAADAKAAAAKAEQEKNTAAAAANAESAAKAEQEKNTAAAAANA